MAKSILERFKAKKAADAREAAGLSRRINSAKKDMAAVKKQLQKLREATVKETMGRLSEILDERTDITRIKANAHIPDRAANEMQEVFQRDIQLEMALLDISRFRLLIEATVADMDIDNITDAKNARSDFDAALAEYLVQTMEANEDICDDKIADMWDNIVGKKNADILTRGTTVLQSVRMHIDKVTDAVNTSGSSEFWQEDMLARLSRLFSKYSIDIGDDAINEMLAAI